MAEKLFEHLATDPFLAPFFDATFNSEAYVRSVIRQDAGSTTSSLEETAAEQSLHAVRQRSNVVEAAIRRLVSSRTDALVQAAARTRELQQQITSVASKTRGIQVVASRIRQDILNPYSELQRDALVLKRVAVATEMFRRVKRTHAALKKLRSIVEATTISLTSSSSSSSVTATSTSSSSTLSSSSSTGAPQPSTHTTSGLTPSAMAAALTSAIAAQPSSQQQARILSRLSPAIREAETCLTDPAMSGIHFLHSERAWVTAVSGAIRQAARTLLYRACDSLNAADVGGALSSLADLGKLPSEATAVIDRIIEGAAAAVKEAFDVRAIAATAGTGLAATGGGSGAVASTTGGNAGLPGSLTRSGGGAVQMPPPGAAAAWRGALWGKCEMMCEALQRACLQAWNVVYVICRKREAGFFTGPGMIGNNSSMSTKGMLGGGSNSGASSSSSSSSSSPLPLLAALATAFHAFDLSKNDNKNHYNSNNNNSITTIDRISAHAAELEAEAAAEAAASSGNVSPADDLFGWTADISNPNHPGVRLLRRFFLGLAAVVRKEVAAVASPETGSPFVRATLVEGYPRLHYLLLDVIPRASRSVGLRTADDEREAPPVLLFGGGIGDRQSDSLHHRGGGMSSSSQTQQRSFIITADGLRIPLLTGTQLFASACGVKGSSSSSQHHQQQHISILVKGALPLQRLYLARSLSRMTDALGQMFPSNHSHNNKSHNYTSSSKRTTGSSLSDPNTITSNGTGAVPSIAVAVNAAGFTPSNAMDKLLDEAALEAPSIQSTQTFVRAIASEFVSCKPPLGLSGMQSSSSSGSSVSITTGFTSPVKGGASSNSSGVSSSSYSMQPDAILYAAVAKGVATVIKLLIAQTESATVVGPAAVAIAEHCMPTPAQLANHGMACRIDDVRAGIAKITAEIPLLPPLDGLAAVDLDPQDSTLKTTASARLAAHPLALPLPPHLLAVYLGLARQAKLQALGNSSNNNSSGLVANTPQGILLKALEGLDKCVESILFPWLLAVVCPFERAVLRLHETTYTTLTGGTNPTSSTASAPTDSEWMTSMESYASGLASHQLQLLPQGGVADTVRTALAARILTLYCRNACLLRAVDDTGRVRIARDCAQLEIAVTPLLHSSSDLHRLGSAYTAIRALRPLIFATTPDIAGALDDVVKGNSNSSSSGGTSSSSSSSSSSSAGEEASIAAAAAARARLRTSLQALKSCDIAHALCSRLPRECALPHTRSRLAPSAYSDWMDNVAAVRVHAADIQSTNSSATATVLPADGSMPITDIFIATRARLFTPNFASHATNAAVSTRLQPCLDDFSTRCAATPGAESPNSYLEYVTLQKRAQWM